VTQNGKYHVVVIDENGCVDTSDVYVVSNQKTSVAPLAQGDEDLILYPNPTQRYCRVAGSGTGTITVFSVDGRVVAGVHEAGRIDMGDCAPGLYWIGIRDKDDRLVAVKKLVKLP
jgi:hypothetical protein